MTETRTYVGESATQAFDGYAGLRIGQRYTGTAAADGTVHVSAVGVLPGAGVTLKAEEWNKWFIK